MKKKTRKLTMFLCCCMVAVPGAALAQESALMSLGKAELRGEIESRYETAIAATLSETVQKSIDSQYYWASEAKVQCGIALGFLKSGTKDENSIGKCEKFSLRMVADPLPPPPPPPPVNQIQCSEQMPMYVYFDWDSAVPPTESAATISLIAENRAQCGWNNFTVIGHTDRSGPDSYNNPLSVERARAAASMLEGVGISAASMMIEGRGETERKVETVDGERNPTNRRVEINAIPAAR